MWLMFRITCCQLSYFPCQPCEKQQASPSCAQGEEDAAAGAPDPGSADSKRLETLTGTLEDLAARLLGGVRALTVYASTGAGAAKLRGLAGARAFIVEVVQQQAVLLTPAQQRELGTLMRRCKVGVAVPFKKAPCSSRHASSTRECCAWELTGLSLLETEYTRAYPRCAYHDVALCDACEGLLCRVKRTSFRGLPASAHCA